MGKTFTKRDGAASGSLLGEGAALGWLSSAEGSGGLRAARVLSVDAAELVEERIEVCGPSSEQARSMGRALAHTHAAGAPWLGCPPPGWQGAYVIAHSETPTIPRDEAPNSWGAFFARWRILHYLSYLRDSSIMDASGIAVLERVAARLERGDFDVEQPALVERAIAEGLPCAGDDRGPCACARIHGDLWAGNLLADADAGNASGGALIDPMAHGGHAETDLAMLQLFGYPHLGELIAGYEEVSALADGWRERVALHQLAPLLHHCVLFGSSYVNQTLIAGRRYV